jgi:hypothetical protein
MGGTSVASGGSSSNGGSSSAGKGGAGGGAGKDPGLPVPRIENTDGDSVLDSPANSLGNGLCEGASVYCNGECLATDGAAKDGCTALKLGLGQATSMALTDDALYYTAANQEILKLDLATGAHTSLVRGLVFVKALAVDDGFLYFGTERPDSFFKYDARRVALSGGDVTVISPEGTEVGAIIPLPSEILLGIGNFECDLYTVPKTGGPLKSFGGIQNATSLVLGGGTLYYRTTDGLSSTGIDAPMPDHRLNSEFSNVRLILEGDYLYYGIQGAYTRTPTAGGAPEKIQDLGSGSGVWGRTPTHVIVGTPDAADKTINHLSLMPIAGGTLTPLATVEAQELRAVAANATEVYLGIGSSHAGALLKVAVPQGQP